MSCRPDGCDGLTGMGWLGGWLVGWLLVFVGCWFCQRSFAAVWPSRQTDSCPYVCTHIAYRTRCTDWFWLACNEMSLDPLYLFSRKYRNPIAFYLIYKPILDLCSDSYEFLVVFDTLLYHQDNRNQSPHNSWITESKYDEITNSMYFCKLLNGRFKLPM